MEQPISDRRFLGIPADELASLGYDPKTRIVPLWFGCRAELAAVPERCPIRLSGRSQFKLFVNPITASGTTRVPPSP